MKRRRVPHADAPPHFRDRSMLNPPDLCTLARWMERGYIIVAENDWSDTEIEEVRVPAARRMSAGGIRAVWQDRRTAANYAGDGVSMGDLYDDGDDDTAPRLVVVDTHAPKPSVPVRFDNAAAKKREAEALRARAANARAATCEREAEAALAERAERQRADDRAARAAIARRKANREHEVVRAAAQTQTRITRAAERRAAQAEAGRRAYAAAQANARAAIARMESDDAERAARQLDSAWVQAVTDMHRMAK